MGIITKDRLRLISESKLGARTFNQFINESRQESKVSTTTSIFLSHSHTDREYVERAVILFRTLGIRIYVDWLDSSMPPVTSAETAKKIKDSIRENDKFILLATNAAINSKWCNWELGYGDAYKYSDKIALLPVSENVQAGWLGNEYLRIYPRIEESNTHAGYNVIYPNGTAKPLIDWLRYK